MQRLQRAILTCVLVALGSCGGGHERVVIHAVTPTVVDTHGNSVVIITGTGFNDDARIWVGGVEAERLDYSPTELSVLTRPMPAGPVLLEVEQRGERHPAEQALEAWNPSLLEQARVYDASFGVTAETAAQTFEWQRVTASMGANWRVRDGNTLTWLPSRDRYVMVGGWNGYQAPQGFSTIDPDSYPPENTTTEVWSSVDGVEWTLDVPHADAQFERRHSHNTVLWNDRLWMIGGDYHQGRENHDVVSSADGRDWRVELGPGADEDPPWSRRVLQVSGVYDGALWTAGGQSVNGDLDMVVYHNDVWRSDDGLHWVQVVADAPASATRWAGCGVLDGLVEFRGELWLVGCARERADSVGHSVSNEVWSSVDGATWTKHATPPWVGKIWPNVVVWQDRLWILFGYTLGDPSRGLPPGNANEVWYSEDGETWQALPFDAPTPGSHAQGIAVREDQLLYAGGNYTFGFGDGEDKSVWRLVPVDGAGVTQWQDRGELGLDVRVPSDPVALATAPLHVPGAFGHGRAGMHFDGSTSLLARLDADGVELVDLAHPGDGAPPGDGFSVFVAARMPYSPAPYGWVENYNPASTIVGSTWPPRSSLGLTDGHAHYVNQREGLDENGSNTWDILTLPHDETDGPLQWNLAGNVHTLGVVHQIDGTVLGLVDGHRAAPQTSDFTTAVGWSRIGGGVDGPGEGPYNRFAGTLGAVVIVKRSLSSAELERLHQWALGRFVYRAD